MYGCRNDKYLNRCLLIIITLKKKCQKDCVWKDPSNVKSILPFSIAAYRALWFKKVAEPISTLSGRGQDKSQLHCAQFTLPLFYLLLLFLFCFFPMVFTEAVEIRDWFDCSTLLKMCVKPTFEEHSWCFVMSQGALRLCRLMPTFIPPWKKKNIFFSCLLDNARLLQWKTEEPKNWWSVIQHLKKKK